MGPQSLSICLPYKGLDRHKLQLALLALLLTWDALSSLTASTLGQPYAKYILPELGAISSGLLPSKLDQAIQRNHIADSSRRKDMQDSMICACVI